jgi:SAM-dependent methyltransferase
MQQTPVHEQHNPDLLSFIPADARSLIEVGCSSGALARAFKAQSPQCHYLGIEIDPAYAELARRHCDESVSFDIESAPDSFWVEQRDRDCWIFGDTLEHLRDPWALLRRIRGVIPAHGSVVACIPNAQHWSLQARLSVGNFRYQSSGLLDRTHLRWFTRLTMIELFEQSGFKVEAIRPRVFNEAQRERFLPLIEQMAQAAGADAQQAVRDAMPMQYVFRVKPRPV